MKSLSSEWRIRSFSITLVLLHGFHTSVGVLEAMYIYMLLIEYLWHRSRHRQCLRRDEDMQCDPVGTGCRTPC